MPFFDCCTLERILNDMMEGTTPLARTMLSHYFRLLATAFLLALSLAPDSARGQSKPFTFITIGDGGDAGTVLDGCARYMLEAAREGDRQGRPIQLLLFLGDNFYPNGLNHPREETRRDLIRDILGPHTELMRKLGRDNVHAIPGNHDYYCATLNSIPYGSCDMGNRYEREIADWTYHMHEPALIRRAVAEGSADSVDMLLFDSSLLLTQDISRWRPALDSMERMLRASATARGVRWRIIMAHHSPYSVGEHGGYRLWLGGERRVGYIGNCLEDRQDPFKYVEQLLSHQDNCTPRYRAYSDSLMALIGRSGAKVQMLMAGHDHSLQLLNYPGRTCDNCPQIFVVSGAGSKRGRVKSPAPPFEFTHPLNTPEETGHSAGGFTICTFEGDTLALTFIDAKDGRPLDMGGITTFRIDRDGGLVR